MTSDGAQHTGSRSAEAAPDAAGPSPRDERSPYPGSGDQRPSFADPGDQRPPFSPDEQRDGAGWTPPTAASASSADPWPAPPPTGNGPSADPWPAPPPTGNGPSADPWPAPPPTGNGPSAEPAWRPEQPLYSPARATFPPPESAATPPLWPGADHQPAAREAQPAPDPLAGHPQVSQDQRETPPAQPPFTDHSAPWRSGGGWQPVADGGGTTGHPDDAATHRPSPAQRETPVYQPAPSPGISTVPPVPLPLQEQRVPGASLSASPPTGYEPPPGNPFGDHPSDGGGPAAEPDPSAGPADDRPRQQEFGVRADGNDFPEPAEPHIPAPRMPLESAFGRVSMPRPTPDSGSEPSGDQPESSSPARPAAGGFTASASVPLANRVMPPTDYTRRPGTVPPPRSRVYGQRADADSAAAVAAEQQQVAGDQSGPFDSERGSVGLAGSDQGLVGSDRGLVGSEHAQPAVPVERRPWVDADPQREHPAEQADNSRGQAPADPGQGASDHHSPAVAQPSSPTPVGPFAPPPNFSGGGAPFGDLLSERRPTNGFAPGSRPEHRDPGVPGADRRPAEHDGRGPLVQDGRGPLVHDSPGGYPFGGARPGQPPIEEDRRGRPDLDDRAPMGDSRAPADPYPQFSPHPARADQQGFAPAVPAVPAPAVPAPAVPAWPASMPAVPGRDWPDTGAESRPGMGGAPWPPGQPVTGPPAGWPDGGPAVGGPVGPGGPDRDRPDSARTSPDDAEQRRFDSFQPQSQPATKPAEPKTDAPTPQVRNGRVLAAVLVTAILILAIPMGTLWLLGKIDGPAPFDPAVGACVKRDGEKPVTADCSEAGAFEVVSKVDNQEKCEDRSQPFVVVPGKDGDRVLCLRPAAAG